MLASGVVGSLIVSRTITEPLAALTKALASVSEEMRAQVQEVSASANSLTGMAQGLQQVVARFKLNSSDGSPAGVLTAAAAPPALLGKAGMN